MRSQPVQAALEKGAHILLHVPLLASTAHRLGATDRYPSPCILSNVRSQSVIGFLPTSAIVSVLALSRTLMSGTDDDSLGHSLNR